MRRNDSSDGSHSTQRIMIKYGNTMHNRQRSDGQRRANAVNTADGCGWRTMTNMQRRFAEMYGLFAHQCDLRCRVKPGVCPFVSRSRPVGRTTVSPHDSDDGRPETPEIDTGEIGGETDTLIMHDADDSHVIGGVSRGTTPLPGEGTAYIRNRRASWSGDVNPVPWAPRAACQRLFKTAAALTIAVGIAWVRPFGLTPCRLCIVSRDVVNTVAREGAVRPRVPGWQRGVLNRRWVEFALMVTGSR